MKSIYPFIQGKQPQISKRIIFHADKNWATCGRIQRDERWWWSTWKEECHLLLTKWNQFIPSSRESNRKSENASFLMRTKTEQPAVAFNATKDDDDLLEKKSVIFCWLKKINLSLHPGKATPKGQTHHFSCGQILSNLRSHSTRRKMIMIYLKKRECHLLLTKWNQFIPSSRESNRKSENGSFFMRRKTKQPAVAFNATKDDDDLLEKKSVIFCWLAEVTLCH